MTATETAPQTAAAITTCGELLNLFLSRIGDGKNPITGGPSRRRLKPRSIEYYGSRVTSLRRSWPSFDSMLAASVTEKQLVEWQTRYWMDNCPEAGNGCLIVLRKIFAIAIRERLRPDDPSQFLERAAAPKRETWVPTRAEWARIVEAMRQREADANHPRSRRQMEAQREFAEFLAQSGARKLAASRLTWRDVDLERKQIAFPAETAKNGRVHVQPMTAATEALLRLAAARQTSRKPGDRVFAATTCAAALENACRLLELPRLRVHDIRKMVSTWVAQTHGVMAAAQWIGHSPEVAAHSYIQVGPDYLRTLAAGM